MATPSYTTDLTDINTAEATSGWAELSGHTGGSAPAQEGDYFIQGSYCVSQSNSKTGTGGGLQYDYGSDLSGSFNTGDCVFAWHVWLAANSVDTFANGGLRLGVGSSSGNIKFWKTGGKDVGRYPYGGWQNFAVDPTYTADYTEGSPTSAYRIFGFLPNVVSAVSKGNPHGVDAIRYGRGEVKIEYGDGTNGYGTFAGIATQNDSQSNRWGLFQEQAGAYLWKGLLSFGNATNACDFRDTNRSIFIDDVPRTYAAFNKIEINNASSRIDWTNISFKSIGTLSLGRFEVVDNADVNFSGCAFTDMSTFILQTNTTFINCIFQGCGLITAAGADMDGSKVQESSVAADASALNWNVATDPDGYLDNMTFSKGSNAHHAIEFGTSSPTSITLRGMTTTGFNASDNQNDSTFYIARNSGTVTINIIGGTGNFSYKSAGATVDIVISPVTLKAVVKTTAGVAISGARVLAKVADGTNFPYQDSVTITGSGTTATVTHTAHGLSTNDYIVISGANEDVYNGVYQLTVTGANTYTYTTNETIGTSPATGTITATMALLNGTTDANGEISDTRTYSADQDIEGWVRKSSSPPYYKQALISDTVDNSTGKTINIQLISDE